jgi:hypothetical protein
MLKLHTDLYEERTKSEVNKMVEDLRKKASRFYGYFIEETDETNWFITDKNLDKDKNYFKIFEVKNNRVIQNKSSFEPTIDKANLLICC